MKPSIILVLCLFLFSCDKEDNADKTVERIFLCTEKPLFHKADSIRIGIRYFKNYKEADQVSLTLNGKNAEFKGFLNNLTTGDNYYFKLPPVNEIGDAEVILTITNSQKSVIKKTTLRFVNDFNVETVWDKLDHAYTVNTFPHMYNSSSVNFGFGGGGITETSLAIGFYTKLSHPLLINVYNSFINGFNGGYLLTYDTVKLLKEIRIDNGNVDLVQGLTYQQILDEVGEFYGPVISTIKDYQGFKITTFQTSRLNIKVYEKRLINGPVASIVTVIALK